MYSLEQLKMFIAVCDHGSFSAAARKLGRAQSGISQGIANLEIDLDTQLFDRTTQPLMLTEDGMALMPFARSILHKQQQFEEKVAALHSHNERQLTIAFDDSLITPELMTVIAQLAEHFPATEISLLTLSTFDVLDKIANGEAQLGLIYADGSTPEHIHFRTIGYSRFVIVAAINHPLSNKRDITLNELKEHRQLLLKSLSHKEFWFNHRVSTQTMYANTHLALQQLAIAGAGWTTIPEYQVAESIAKGLLCRLHTHFEPQGWLNTIDLIKPKHLTEGPVQASFTSMLEAFYTGLPNL